MTKFRHLLCQFDTTEEVGAKYMIDVASNRK